MKINKKQIFRSYSRQAGFTLIELITAIGVFSIIITIVVAIFARAVFLERKLVSTQKVQDNSMLIIESMAKEIRVSTVSLADNNCFASPYTALVMNHPIYGTVNYSLDGSGNVVRQASFTGAGQAGFNSIVNSSDVKFTRMNFCVNGSAAGDDQSTRVTIVVSLYRTTSPDILVNLQTTVTIRDISNEGGP